MKLEYYWYEASPFLYTATGGALLGRADSVLSIISSVLLLTAGGTILFLRRRHALQMREQHASDKDSRRAQARPPAKSLNSG
jgi:hypothetical protein